jgi:hypothetical protein
LHLGEEYRVMVFVDAVEILVILGLHKFLSHFFSTVHQLLLSSNQQKNVFNFI